MAALDAPEQLSQLWDATPEALVFDALEDDVALEHISRGVRAGVAVSAGAAAAANEEEATSAGWRMRVRRG